MWSCGWSRFSKSDEKKKAGEANVGEKLEGKAVAESAERVEKSLPLLHSTSSVYS